MNPPLGYDGAYYYTEEEIDHILALADSLGYPLGEGSPLEGITLAELETWIATGTHVGHA